MLGTSFKLTTHAVRRDLRSNFQWGFDPATRTWHLGTPGKGNFTILLKPVRQFMGLELGIEGRWQQVDFRTSYMLSRSHGNYPGLYNSDQGFANPGGIGTFIVPEHGINSTGLLPNDHTHLSSSRDRDECDLGSQRARSSRRSRERR